MIYFRSDYSQGAHPDVLQAIIDTNEVHCDGYAEDKFCENAAELVRELIGKKDAHVHMMGGGTPANVITIAAALRPYECVIAPRSAHIYAHETGAVEATGHKIIPMDPIDGKLTCELIQKACEEYEDCHTPLPRLVYISNSTEIGTLYSKSELEAISQYCRSNNLLLFMDGARLGSALTSDINDLSIKDIANLVDAFYIGGTKNGALFGEALIILNDDLNDHFRWMIKRHCGMLAKGRLIGVQFEALLKGGENSLYFKLARKTNEMANKLREGIASFGYKFDGESNTNQIFPIFPIPLVKALEKEFFFYEWGVPNGSEQTIRLVTSWGTVESDVEAFLDFIKNYK